MSRSPWVTIVSGAIVVLCTAVPAALWMGVSSSLQTAVAQTPPLIAAKIGNRAVSVTELDERWKRESPGEHGAAMQKLFEGRSSALDSLLSDVLIEEAAHARGMSVPQFIDFEVRQRTTPVGEREVRAFYEANAASFGGTPLDGLRNAIRPVLERRNRDRALTELVAALMPEGPNVEMMLRPPSHVVPVHDTDPAKGDRKAAVTIVAFSDFQCPFCARLEPILNEVSGAYGDAVRVVWKDFPLTAIHPDAFKAAEASHCAAEQARYWDYHRRLFENQQSMGLPALKAHAAAIGLDMARFDSCLESSRYAARVQESLDTGASVGVQATPTVFINGRALHGAQPFNVFAKFIDEELYRAGQPSPMKQGDVRRASNAE